MASMVEDDFVLVCHDDAICRSADTSPKYIGEIDGFIDKASDDLWDVNKQIHDNPELGYEEHKAHALLTSFMKSRNGWKVTTSAYGMETAWVAVYDSGKKGPVVSFNVEMDALPGIGHACGHNLIATASLASGLATAEIMRRHNLKGKVVLFGTPAEEGGGGKIRLLKAGAYEDYAVDVSLISHPGILHNSALVRTSAYARFKAEYFGRQAHAANSPWLGINALDALVMAYNGLSVLRQQTMPGDIIQGHITDGGMTPNIIHAYAAGTFVVRANTASQLQELQRKVNACFCAGAEATGARLEITPVQMYADHVPNRVLGASYVQYWNCLNPPSLIPTNPEIGEIQESASTDQGDVSRAIPSLSVSFAIPPGPEGNGPHSPDFEIAAGTREAFRRCLRTGKALAGIAVDVLTTQGLLSEVKEQWKRDMAASN
ncbi:putative peptidase m20 protein [Venustampulla echinocandica]|uniref:Peptidase M20 domain-containing protein 2 n=1 Tax=Venustampulla echinocandica TaxID=2656787 RepID=A0A370TSK6_9HELO|nr:putative peptidase m20 protein [Venustampulla echinocandica]RDL38510.1 putative peptidase m20 protein [Venustampulla echinocandica]